MSIRDDIWGRRLFIRKSTTKPFHEKPLIWNSPFSFFWGRQNNYLYQSIIYWKHCLMSNWDYKKPLIWERMGRPWWGFWLCELRPSTNNAHVFITSKFVLNVLYFFLICNLFSWFSTFFLISNLVSDFQPFQSQLCQHSLFTIKLIINWNILKLSLKWAF